MEGLYKKEIFELLEQKGIPFEKMEHEAVFTMEEMDRAGITKKGCVCKNLFLRDAKGKQHYLVTAPEDKRVDMKKLAAQIGSTRLSFASPERLERYLKIQQGSVSPLCILNDESRTVIFVADEDLKQEKEIGVHPNDNTATLWISFQDLEGLIREHGNETAFAHFEPQEPEA